MRAPSRFEIAHCPAPSSTLYSDCEWLWSGRSTIAWLSTPPALPTDSEPAVRVTATSPGRATAIESRSADLRSCRIPLKPSTAHNTPRFTKKYSFCFSRQSEHNLLNAELYTVDAYIHRSAASERARRTFIRKSPTSPLSRCYRAQGERCTAITQHIDRHRTKKLDYCLGTSSRIESNRT